MSVEIIGTQSLVDSPGPKCRLCDNPPHLSFNWKYAEQHAESDLHALFDAIEPVRNLKFGSLHVCRLCELNWVLDGQGRMMTRVPNDRRDLLGEWDANRLSIETAHAKTLEGIGGVALDLWPGRDRLIVVPCALVMHSGERIDPAVIWITTRPPIDNFGSRPRLFRDVCLVEASRFALPLEVRRATASAPEVRMGFAPTRVVATDGTPFLLHWATSVFDRGGIAGSEIRVSRRRLDLDEEIAVAKADSELATYFFADWFEGAEDLNKIWKRKRATLVDSRSVETGLRRHGLGVEGVQMNETQTGHDGMCVPHDIEIAKNKAAPLLERFERALAAGEITEEQWYREWQAIITPAYLAGDNPRAQSGHSGDEARWTHARSLIAEAIHRDGTFLDVGCASGHLMECMVRWASERGFVIEPYGLDIAPELADLARRRLPHWADRIFVGNAIEWNPPRRFGFVRTGLEYVPVRRQRDLVTRLLAEVVAPGGRLIIGSQSEEVGKPGVADLVSGWGFTVGGQSQRAHRDSRLVYRVIWIDQTARNATL